jgi:hypothetical protein
MVRLTRTPQNSSRHSAANTNSSLDQWTQWMSHANPLEGSCDLEWDRKSTPALVVMSVDSRTLTSSSVSTATIFTMITWNVVVVLLQRMKDGQTSEDNTLFPLGMVIQSVPIYWQWPWTTCKLWSTNPRVYSQLLTVNRFNPTSSSYINMFWTVSQRQL